MAKREPQPSLPRTVAQELPILHRFLVYLNQHPTKDAILGLALKKGKLEVTSNYMHSLCSCSANTDDDLREIIKLAPALEAIVVLAYGVSKSVLPAGTIPSQACLVAALDAYHSWVRRM